VDGTALVQEFFRARRFDRRVEVLNGEFLYAIRIWPDSQLQPLSRDICQAI